jgi:hypothetical protein
VVDFSEGGFIGVGDPHSGNLEGPPRLLWAVPVELVRPLLGYRLALGVPSDEFLGERLGNETIEGLDQLARGPLGLGHALGEGLLVDGHPEGRHLGDDLDHLVLQGDDVVDAIALFHPRVEDVAQFVEVLDVGGRVGEHLGGELPEPVGALLFLGDLDLKEPL